MAAQRVKIFIIYVTLILWQFLQMPASSLFLPLNQYNLVHILKLLLVKLHFNIIFLFRLFFVQFVTLDRSSLPISASIFIAAMRATCRLFLGLFDIVILLTSVEELKLLNCILQNFFDLLVTSYLFVTNLSLLLLILEHPQHFLFPYKTDLHCQAKQHLIVDCFMVVCKWPTQACL
jgi:hypothetical protein